MLTKATRNLGDLGRFLSLFLLFVFRLCAQWIPSNTVKTAEAQSDGALIALQTGYLHFPVCSGSVLPLWPDEEYATEKIADPIEIRVYRGADGSFTLMRMKTTITIMRRARTRRFYLRGTTPRIA